MRALAAALVVTLGGCSWILGIDDVTQGAPANTVVGTVTTHCLQVGDVTATQPHDLSVVAIRALIPDATDPSGYVARNGTGKADGTFEIDDVPDGTPYTLTLDTSYFVTSAHTLDLHFDTSERCDPAPAIAQGATPLQLTVTGTEPFLTGDHLAIDATSLAYVAGESPIDWSGGTALTLDWQTASDDGSRPIPLLDQTVGDDLTLTHRRSKPRVGDDRVYPESIVEYASVTGVTLTGGAPAMVTGAYTPAPNNRHFALSLDRVAYDTAFSDVNAYNAGIQATITAAPVKSNTGAGVTLFDLDMFDFSHGSVGYFGDQDYADPFPESWSRYITLYYPAFRLFAVNDSGSGNFAGYTAVLPLGATAPDLAPTLTAPTLVKLAGQPFTLGGRVMITDTTPVNLTWTAVSGARVYELTVFRFAFSGSSYSETEAAHLQTAEPQLAIPAEVFAGGGFYTLTLSATVSPADYAHGELVSNGTPSVRAVLASGVFRIGATCGNGVTDEGEQCDGDSATCDPDCTHPSCGDGMLNTLAGETCDDGADTYGCDGDCTAVMCGDGYVNDSTEDCEPPGSVGCSASCHYTDVCGNGLLEAHEDCDGTPNCNPDCTLKRCGDAIVVAPETCDDGNLDAGDGCSPTCVTE